MLYDSGGDDASPASNIAASQFWPPFWTESPSTHPRQEPSPKPTPWTIGLDGSRPQRPHGSSAPTCHQRLRGSRSRLWRLRPSRGTRRVRSWIGKSGGGREPPITQLAWWSAPCPRGFGPSTGCLPEKLIPRWTVAGQRRRALATAAALAAQAGASRGDLVRCRSRRRRCRGSPAASLLRGGGAPRLRRGIRPEVARDAGPAAAVDRGLASGGPFRQGPAGRPSLPGLRRGRRPGPLEPTTAGAAELC